MPTTQNTPKRRHVLSFVMPQTYTEYLALARRLEIQAMQTDTTELHDAFLAMADDMKAIAARVR